MDIRILNYSGISLAISWSNDTEIISCNSEKTLQIEKSNARLTRFFAKYKSLPSAPVRIKGQINLIFDTSHNNQTLILGAFIYGEPKYVGCIAINDSGKYLYSEHAKSDIEKQYPEAKFYNIPLNLEFESTAMGQIRKLYYTVFSTYNCENRDAPMCDKVVGLPILILIIVFLILVIVVVVSAIGFGMHHAHQN